MPVRRSSGMSKSRSSRSSCENVLAALSASSARPPACRKASRPAAAFWTRRTSRSRAESPGVGPAASASELLLEELEEEPEGDGGLGLFRLGLPADAAVLEPASAPPPWAELPSSALSLALPPASFAVCGRRPSAWEVFEVGAEPFVVSPPGRSAGRVLDHMPASRSSPKKSSLAPRSQKPPRLRRRARSFAGSSLKAADGKSPVGASVAAPSEADAAA
mmetsp:Transcript_99504/g.264460  ORF Transcript_99504/g.264460 Transcript_99504/m.264460 type:complete len:219 (+) Transcript_99504:391-1047(+)